MEKIKVLNIFIENLSTAELLQQLDERGGIVFTPNIDHLMILQKIEISTMLIKWQTTEFVMDKY